MDPRRRSLLLLIIIYLGFVSLGLPDGTLGAAWPEVYPELHLPVGMAGTILTVGTLLTAVAAFSSGAIIARWRTGPVVLVSGLLTAGGMLILSKAQGGLWFYGAAIPLGLGAGAVDAGLNGYVAKHYSGRHMNWLHACWGIGATGGPFLIGWFLARGHGWRGGYLAISCTQFGLSLLFLLTLRLWSLVPERADDSGVRQETPGATTPANSLAGWLSPAIFALYVAAEWTTGLWASTILVADRGIAPETAALCVAGYWGSLTVGRVAVGFTVEHWGNRRTINGGLLVAALGLVGFTLSDNVALAAVALGAAGLGLAPIYPGLMSEVPRRFAPGAVQTIIGRQSGGAAFGSAVLPALAGGVAQSSLAIVPWLALGALVLLTAGIRWLNRIT